MAINLQTACIFDFTIDTGLIEKIVGYLPEQKEYRQETTQEARVIHLMDYASEIKDKKLTKQLNEAFEEQLNNFFNE